MEFVQIKRRVRGKSRSFWWCKHYSAIWSNSREHSKNVFAVNLGHRNNVHNFFENQTRLQNSTDTTRKSLIFRELCALFDSRIRPDCRIALTPRERAWFSANSVLYLKNNSSGINRDILKHPTWSGAKNSNKFWAPSHLVTCFPCPKSQCVGGPNDCSKFMNRDRYFSAIWSMVRSVTVKLS